MPNIQSCLLLWSILGAFSAGTYLPTLLVERPLFIRYAGGLVLRLCRCHAHARLREEPIMPDTLRCSLLHPCRPAVGCRERNDGCYRVITYLVEKLVQEMGLVLLNSLVFCEWAGGRPWPSV